MLYLETQAYMQGALSVLKLYNVFSTQVLGGKTHLKSRHFGTILKKGWAHSYKLHTRAMVHL